MEMDHYTQSSKTVKYFAIIILHSRIIKCLHASTYVGQQYRQRLYATFLTEAPSAKAKRKGKRWRKTRDSASSALFRL